MPVRIINESADPTVTAPNTLPLETAEGSLTLAGRAVVAFLEAVDFSPLFEIAEGETPDDEHGAVESLALVDESEAIHDATDDALSVLVALTEATKYKPLTRTQVIKRMRNAKVQTSSEKAANRKAKMYRRRNRAKLKIGKLRRAGRLGNKIAAAAKRRGLSESEAAEVKFDEAAYEAEEKDYAILCLPTESIEEIVEALTAAELIDEVSIEDPDSNLVESESDDEDMTMLIAPMAVAEGLVHWLEGHEIVEAEEIGAETHEDALTEAVDMDDLGEMFADYLDDLAESELLTERAVAAVFADHFGVDAEGGAITEATKAPWKRGDFVKFHKGKKKTTSGRTGPEIVNAMLGAMIHKGAIKKVAPNKAYKAPGSGKSPTYNKDSGYGEGTVSGVTKWKKYLATSKGETGKKKLQKATGKKDKAAAAKGAGKKDKKGAVKTLVAKAKTLAAKLKTKGKKGKKAANESETGTGTPINEGAPATPKVINETQRTVARMVGGAVAGRSVLSQPITEAATTSAGPSSRAAVAARIAGVITESVAANEVRADNDVVRKLFAKSGMKPSALNETDYGCIYTPAITEGHFRMWAKDLGFTRKNSHRLVHESAPGVSLVLTRERILVTRAD